MSVSAVDLILEDCAAVMQADIELFSALRNSTIVITGGTGFIGTWIAELISYLNDQHAFNTQVFLLARNIEHFKKHRSHLANRKDIKLLSSDVRYLMELPTETNWIIHAAGTPDNRFHSSYPLETMSTISAGTYSVLRAAERCSNLQMFLNISSGLVYGSQPLRLTRMSESYIGAPQCGTVSSAYAEAKRFAETLCQSSRSQARIPIVTARPFAFIGPYQSLETPWAINNFVKDALSGSTIRILGDGKTVRSYMYASDMAFWFLSILLRGQSGEIYNVGSPNSVTLAKLAQVVKNQFTSSSLEVELKTAYFNHLQSSRFVPDISLAKNTLQLSLSIDIKTAIKKTIEWNKLQ